MDATGNTALITGGASGIGLAIAAAFAKHGNKVIAVGRNADKLAEAKARLPGLDTLVCDLRDEQQLERLAIALRENYPALNVLVNNAGVQYNYAFLVARVDEVGDTIAEEIRLNLTAPIQLTARLLPHLAAQRQAAIVNVTSGVGIVPKQSAPVYCATKAGLRLYTAALRHQLAATNVRVFELIPPLVDTAMTEGRGSGKMSPKEVADRFWAAFARDRLEVPVGKIRLLKLLHRAAPRFAENLLKNS